MEINERLVQIRENHFHTQQQTAELLDIDRSTYSKYETNKVNISLDKLCIFATIYNTRLDYILGLSKNKTPLGQMKEFDISVFARNIKELRIKNNYTQNTLGKVLSCSESTINKHEHAVHLMSYETLIELSKLYKVPSDTIAGIVEINTQKPL